MVLGALVSTEVCGYISNRALYLEGILLDTVSMPLIKKCKICKKEFKTKPFFVKNGAGKYCSVKCHYVGLKTGKMIPCAVCGKETYKTLKALRISKSKKYFCTRSCQTKWRNALYVGSKHSNFRTGEYAYRSMLDRYGVPKFCRLCKTKDVRVLAVHHIDENHSNNKLNNLAWVCHNCHHLVHHYENEKQKFMVTIV